jgi:glycolate oxidase iron-sulfur subunit
MQQGDVVEQILSQLGFKLAKTQDRHLCCGSAGTYSILQPELSEQLLTNKLKALTVDKPTKIVTSNIGCQLHLDSQSTLPIRHWIELLDG